MTEPMTDERLAEIRLQATEGLWRGAVKRAAEDVLELLDEVDRYRALAVPAGFLESSIEATPEQIAEWQAAWDELHAGGVAGYDLPAPVPRGAMWEPLRDQPRSRDYPTGG